MDFQNFEELFKGRKKYFFLLLTVFVFLLPIFFQYSFDSNFHLTSFYFGIPKFLSGDEPHYLVMTYSIVKDFDLELSNNYKDYIDSNYGSGAFFGWNDLFGHIVFIDKKTLKLEDPYIAALTPQKYFQFPYHHIGLPLFASFFVFPFSFLPVYTIESALVVLSVLVSLTGFFFLFKIIKHYSDNTKIAIFSVLCFAFATPLWHYSKTFFVDPYQATLLIISYYFFAVKKQNLLPGFLLGIAFLMKYSFALMIIPFVVFKLFEKDWKKTVIFCIPVAFFVLFLLALNSLFLYHISFLKGVAMSYGNIFLGIFVSLFSLTQGLLPFSPFLIFCVLGLKDFYKAHKKEFFLLVSLFLLNFLFYAFISTGMVHTGATYSNRYILSVLPLLAVPFSFWLLKKEKSKWIKVAFILLLLYSFIINFLAAFFYPAFWNRTPWFLVQALISNPQKLLGLI